jgi:hypothetical protein
MDAREYYIDRFRELHNIHPEFIDFNYVKMSLEELKYRFEALIQKIEREVEINRRQSMSTVLKLIIAVYKTNH